MQEVDHSEYALVDITVLSVSFGTSTFVSSSTQTESKRFFSSSPFIDDGANGNNKSDECMEHDVVLLSACPRSDPAGILLIDAWTQTNTSGFLYALAADDELSDEETLCDDSKKDTKADPPDGYQILMNFLTQKIAKFMQGIDKYIPRSRMNSLFKFLSIGFSVGMRFSIATFKRIRLWVF